MIIIFGFHVSSFFVHIRGKASLEIVSSSSWSWSARCEGARINRLWLALGSDSHLNYFTCHCVTLKKALSFSLSSLLHRTRIAGYPCWNDFKTEKVLIAPTKPWGLFLLKSQHSLMGYHQIVCFLLRENNSTHYFRSFRIPPYFLLLWSLP